MRSGVGAAGMRRVRIHHRRARQHRACDQDGKQHEGRRNGAELLRKLYDIAIRFARKYPQRVGYNSCTPADVAKLADALDLGSKIARHATANELPKNLYRIGGKVSPPVLIHKVEPAYPKTAQRAKIEGRVILSAEVRTDGRAYNLQVVQSLDPDLDLQAIDAVTQWRFHPGMRDGSPVAVLATFEVNFKLR